MSPRQVTIIGVDVGDGALRNVSHRLKTAEFTDLEPDAVEYKFYCRSGARA